MTRATTLTSMRVLAFLLAWWGGEAAASVAQLDLAGYQRGSGAITLRIAGDSVDPYFATKALLAAHESGLGIEDAGKRWIRWLLRSERRWGGFHRYCLRAGSFSPCATLDADDAMRALWIELLVTLAPRKAMPRDWRASLERARRDLDRLRDRASGLYQISGGMKVGLLMDNTEVYASLRALSRYQNRGGQRLAARATAARADRLRLDMLKALWDATDGRFRASTQARQGDGFYPDEVAQLFPLLACMATPVGDAGAVYAKWMASNRQAWLAQSGTDYVWGLVALAAMKAGDGETVVRWLDAVGPLRHGARWNVLEEALYQGLGARAGGRQASAVSCASTGAGS